MKSKTGLTAAVACVLTLLMTGGDLSAQLKTSKKQGLVYANKEEIPGVLEEILLQGNFLEEAVYRAVTMVRELSEDKDSLRASDVERIKNREESARRSEAVRRILGSRLNLTRSRLRPSSIPS